MSRLHKDRTIALKYLERVMVSSFEFDWIMVLGTERGNLKDLKRAYFRYILHTLVITYGQP